MEQNINPNRSEILAKYRLSDDIFPKYIEPTYYIKYYKEHDSSNKPHYKKIEGNDPNLVNYENGMHFFIIKKFIKVTIDGKTLYIDYDSGEKSYGFGEVATAQEILDRINKGEHFSYDYIEILKANKKRKYFITGTKDLGYDLFGGYVAIDPTKNHDVTPDEDIEGRQIISAKPLWFIEYTLENGEHNIFQTYCNDMIFRSKDSSFEKVKEYRYLKAVIITVNDKEYTIIYDKDKIIHKNVEHRQSSDIDIAVDESKYMIFNKKAKEGHLFNGYTPLYPFNTEDISSVLNIRQEYIKDSDVLTVTGSGDALIDLFLYGANKVTCFDTNKLAKYWARLKFYAIKGGLTFEEYLKFIQGDRKGDSILSIDIYRKFYEIMDSETKGYWDEIYKYLQISKEKILNSEHSLIYSLMGIFGSSNCSFNNPSSYCNAENYLKVQNILQTKTIEDMTFIDSPLFELDDKLSNKKFNYIYLSNIMDFTSTFINDDDLNNRLNIFKEYIKDILSQHIATDGLIDLAYLKYYGMMNFSDICGKLEQYQEVFGEEDGFKLEDLLPYNNKDHVIRFKNKILEKK